ncbi:unnamed protein product [Sphagnum balticum]
MDWTRSPLNWSWVALNQLGHPLHLWISSLSDILIQIGLEEVGHLRSDAVIRRTLWNFADKIVAPYNFTVTNFTDKVSDWRNSLSHAFVDEGLVVPISEGANGQMTGNVLAGNNDSLAFARTAEQVFATVYGTGSASKPGGFFPQGADGIIAKHFLKS